MKVSLLTLLFLWSLGTFAQSNKEDDDKPENPYGTLHRFKLANAAFPDSKRENGHTYEGKTYSAAKHYQDSTVLVFVPSKFSPRSGTDVVLYLHGWHNSVDSALVQFNLINQFVQANRNAILVMPETARNAPDSYAGRLERPAGLQLLMNELVNRLIEKQVLRNTRIDHLVLAGHSGAYRGLAHLAQHGGLPVSEVYLFDGLYGQQHKFAQWLQKNPKARLVNIYTDGGGTFDHSEEFLADLKHWGLAPVAVKELEMSLADLEKGRVVFVHSPANHNEVLSRNNSLYKCLVTSPNLKEILE
ncbi:MAG: hypothetical protein MUC97_01040 [Bernardetiaceae bacterium]|jgi:hypothetical protein|nr:hypothetical protein [Bernardetiaceae bacterium]